MSEQVASHSDDVQEVPKGLSEEQLAEVMKELGYAPKTPPKASEEPTDDVKEEEEDIEEETPATEQPKNVRKVKFNKKEIEIPEDQIDELLQKGLALEKERERKAEAEKALQRAAKLAGYDKVEDYIADMDNIEQRTVKQREDAFAEIKRQLLAEAEENGIDPEKLEQYLDSHPLLNQAKELVERDKQSFEARKQQEQQQQAIEGWNKLFAKYPNLAEEMSEDGAEAPWLTPDMIARINKGYDPIDAYELVHRDKIMEEEKQRAKQEMLKQQRLNKRASVEKNASSEPDDDVPENIKGAFAMFGLDPRKAKKFMK